MGLPIITSPEDIEVVVSYLRNKPTGATIVEARASINPSLLDGRKVSAYQSWGFVTKEGEKLRLTELGRDLSRSLTEDKATCYIKVLQRMKSYEQTLEWIHYQHFPTISVVDIAAHWHEHFHEETGSNNDKTISKQVVCFLGIAQAAELGTMRVGRRGHQTRFEVDESALKDFIDGTSTDEDDIDSVFPQQPESMDDFENSEPISSSGNGRADPPKTSPIDSAALASQSPRVFIAHSKNSEIVDQIKTMLDLANMAYEIAEEEETTAIPVPEKVLNAMRRCTAAVICVTADAEKDDEEGRFLINENVLIEIGAAFVLYDKKVVLIWDRRISVPSNLQGLYRCDFEGSELSWSTGMRLMRAVNNFKDPQIIHSN